MEEQRFNPLDLEPDVAIGIGLPLANPTAGDKDTPIAASIETAEMDVAPSKKVGGVFNQTYTTLEQIKSNLKNLVLTNPGERFYHPNFGVGVQGLLFQNITPSVLTRLQDTIVEQVGFWLPYVTIKDIVTDVSEVDSNKVRIQIDYIIYENDLDLQSVVIFS